MENRIPIHASRRIGRPGLNALRRVAPLILLALVMLVDATPATAGLTIYYVRHAQVLSNQSKTGSATTFTENGLTQVQTLATSLQNLQFDFIAVGPTWRTRNTILPYLKATGQVAEIWPELTETGKGPAQPEFSKDAPSPKLFEGVGPIELPEEEKPFFRFRADGSGEKKYKSTGPADALALARKVEELLLARFGKKDVKVLLVGHGSASATLIRQLTRDPSFDRALLDNTRCWVATEKPEGGFALGLYNVRADKLVPAP